MRSLNRRGFLLSQLMISLLLGAIMTVTVMKLMSFLWGGSMDAARKADAEAQLDELLNRVRADWQQRRSTAPEFTLVGGLVGCVGLRIHRTPTGLPIAVPLRTEYATVCHPTPIVGGGTALAPLPNCGVNRPLAVMRRYINGVAGADVFMPPVGPSDATAGSICFTSDGTTIAAVANVQVNLSNRRVVLEKRAILSTLDHSASVEILPPVGF